ncbi:MAG: sigma-70 family RNA polymerase sigma factor [Clostridia bacterium]|nr:sigma-70 family RNA polymerase sigma factor [Clostridia bacterium]
MDKKDFDDKISDAAKSILSYCLNRTSNRFDAEDLAQDIIFELCKSAENLRNDAAFYGFMWSVAGNVYKQWCRKKKNTDIQLVEEVTNYDDVKDDYQLNLLRRELSILSEQYRKAVILYYIENKSCKQISDILSVSESMVKYLLFKSRQILKEGITMERTYGEQSYNPRELSILYWGNGKKSYCKTLEKRLAQNIIFACYNDRLTAEQISLELGVSLPYIEDILKELCEYEILKLNGKKYYTNIVILTREMDVEISNKTARLKENIADSLQNVIESRNLSNSQAWLSVCCILYKAIFEKLQGRVSPEIPENKFGENCIVWAVEKGSNSMRNKGFSFGVSNTENENGDRVQFFDFSVNGEMVHHSFYTSQSLTNVFVDIAKGKTDFTSEFDKAIVAELVQKGYVLNTDEKLSVNVPVFTKSEFDIFIGSFADVIDIVEQNAESIMKTAAKIIRNYIPVHLKNLSADMAYFRIFEDAISMPVGMLAERKILYPYSGQGVLPTTYVLLNE